MEITVVINEVEYRFRVNAATTFLYRQQFGKDLIKSFQKLTDENDVDAIDMLTELAYIAAKQADKTMTLSFYEWLEQFQLMELYQDILPAVSKLWADSNKTASRSKK